jgi:hypothetical protein
MTDARAHSRRYYREEFDGRRRWPSIRRVLLVLTIVLMVAASHVAAIIFGIYEGRRLERLEQAAAPKPVVSHAAPLTQWSCTAQEFREHRHACARRALNALTPKEK